MCEARDSSTEANDSESDWLLRSRMKNVERLFSGLPNVRRGQRLELSGEEELSVS